MVEEQLVGRGVKDKRVLEVMGRIPRHLFVREELRDKAYGDYPLPIGENQTISQPYMIAIMTELLELKGNERILEIGTGSGYQAAVLSQLLKKVYSIERIESLAIKARDLLEYLGYINIEIRVSDGTCGWKEMSPFERIIVTAGAPEIPQPLVEQLEIGGKIVIPVGGNFSQTLIKGIRTQKGIETEDITGCVFVKLIGEYGWGEE
jgi:protein-L-isoaspartate(D-aspartate) O-methyltransferase